MSRAEDIVAGIGAVRARIAEAERAAGRPPGCVELIAVSKRMPPDDIRAACAVGQIDFGENYAQELRDKRAVLRASSAPRGQEHGPAGCPELRWHYIGPLQSNKVKYLAGQVHLIHSVDSSDIVSEINRRAASAMSGPASGGGLPATPRGALQNCLVQVNVAGEARKGGVQPERLPALLDQFATCTHAACVGVMLIPPFSDRADEVRRHFAALHALVQRERRVARPNVVLRELSMGMSHDFAEAIAEGATMVRVGTAIFGARSP
jgi:pyridoxal phosphate enzyme (YggS family)